MTPTSTTSSAPKFEFKAVSHDGVLIFYGRVYPAVQDPAIRQLAHVHSHQTTPQARGALITPQSTPHKAMAPQA